MPKLLRLNGKEVIDILLKLGFELTRTKGSHYRLKYVSDICTCSTSVPVHGKKPLKPGTLKSIYRQILVCFSEEDAKPYFYGE